MTPPPVTLLSDDISDAYEDNDAELMGYLLNEVQRYAQGEDEPSERPCSTGTGAPEFESALQEAMRSKDLGDDLRYSLMVGFTIGLMHGGDDPRDQAYGSVRDKIVRGYETGCDELLREAQGTLGFATRMTDPGSFLSDGEARRYYEKRFQTMRWAQNFGLRRTRAGDRRTSAQRYLWINHRLSRGNGG